MRYYRCAMNMKIKPWNTLARHRRRNDVVILRNRIREQNGKSGRLFITEFGLPGDNGMEPGYKPSWSDFYFLSQKHPIDRKYYGRIITAAHDLDDKVMLQAFKSVDADLTEDEYRLEHDLVFIPVEFDVFGKPKLFEMKINETQYEKFDGRTYLDEVNYRKLDIKEKLSPTIREQFTIDPEFKTGVGVMIVVDVPYIDADVINNSIKKFWELGEQSWTGSDPCVHLEFPSHGIDTDNDA